MYHTDRGISFNDVQLKGEKLQENLADFIMRFRCHPVAVTPNIKNMFFAAAHQSSAMGPATNAFASIKKTG